MILTLITEIVISESAPSLIYSPTFNVLTADYADYADSHCVIRPIPAYAEAELRLRAGRRAICDCICLAAKIALLFVC